MKANHGSSDESSNHQNKNLDARPAKLEVYQN